MTTVSTSRRQGVNSSAAIKSPCNLATTANITLSGEQSIDGTTTSSSRVLVKNQSTASANGIYDSSTSAWTRAPDFDGTYDVVTGTLIKIISGTTNGGYFYEVTNSGTITIGTTSLTFQRSTLIPGIASSTTSTAITIDSSNNVTLAANLTAEGNAVALGSGTAATNARVTINGGNNSGTGSQIRLQRGGTSAGYLMTDAEWLAASSANIALVAESGNSIKLFTNGSVSPRVTIDTSGNLLVTKSSSAFGTTGIELRADSTAYFTVDGTPISINRITTDGAVLNFNQDSVVEGSVSVSGTVVSYNSFCGGHWSQLFDNSNPVIAKGTVVSTIDVLCAWDGEDNEQLARFEVSQAVNDKRVYGVFREFDEEGDAIIHSLGASVIRVTGPCEGGDLLTSNGDGTAVPQADNIIRSHTIGKVTVGVPGALIDDENLLPCTLYCG